MKREPFMKRILVVEDDSTLAASMVQGLKAEPSK